MRQFCLKGCVTQSIIVPTSLKGKESLQFQLSTNKNISIFVDSDEGIPLFGYLPIFTDAKTRRMLSDET